MLLVHITHQNDPQGLLINLIIIILIKSHDSHVREHGHDGCWVKSQR